VSRSPADRGSIRPGRLPCWNGRTIGSGGNVIGSRHWCGRLALLEPRSPGRPAKPEPPIAASEVQALRERVRELEARAAAVEVQAELARTLPHVLHRPRPGKKTKLPARRRPVRLPPQ